MRGAATKCRKGFQKLPESGGTPQASLGLGSTQQQESSSIGNGDLGSSAPSVKTTAAAARAAGGRSRPQVQVDGRWGLMPVASGLFRFKDVNKRLTSGRVMLDTVSLPSTFLGRAYKDPINRGSSLWLQIKVPRRQQAAAAASASELLSAAQATWDQTAAATAAGRLGATDGAGGGEEHGKPDAAGRAGPLLVGAVGAQMELRLELKCMAMKRGVCDYPGDLRLDNEGALELGAYEGWRIVFVELVSLIGGLYYVGALILLPPAPLRNLC